jgi:hypothetical protein
MDVNTDASIKARDHHRRPANFVEGCVCHSDVAVRPP